MTQFKILKPRHADNAQAAAAAKGCSPRRKPWVRCDTLPKPRQGRKKECNDYDTSSTILRIQVQSITPGSRREQYSLANPWHANTKNL